MTDRELMQMALNALELVTDLTTHDDELYEAIDAIRARLTQPEPLPAKSKGALSHEENKQHNKKILDKFYEDNAHLYTTPPQREWQGLTDEEIKEIVGPWGSLPISGYTRKLFDQIEAKLKERNSA